MDFIYEGYEYFDNGEEFFFFRNYSGLINGYLEYKFDFEDLVEIR